MESKASFKEELQYMASAYGYVCRKCGHIIKSRPGIVAHVEKCLRIADQEESVLMSESASLMEEKKIDLIRPGTPLQRN